MGDMGNALLTSAFHRDYDTFQSEVKRHLGEFTWTRMLCETNRSLQDYRIEKGFGSHFGNGFVRDALVHTLGLDIIRGLDFELFGIFKDLEATSLKGLRSKAESVAMEQLKNQMDSRNTFFLNTDAMSTSRYAVFIPEIIKARTDEIQQLSAHPSLRELYSTYYGFLMLVNGGIKSNAPGLQEETKCRIEEFSDQLGKKTVINARIPKRSKNAFPNCTSETSSLLWELVRMSNGGYGTRFDSLKRIRQIGDSRVLESVRFQAEYQKGGFRSNDFYVTLLALGDLSYEAVIRNNIESRHSRRQVLQVLQSTVFPGLDDLLIKALENNRRYSSGELYNALARTGTEKSRHFLTARFRFGQRKERVQSMKALLKYCKDGISIINDESDSIAEMIMSGPKPVDAVRIAGQLPDFVWTDRLRTRIAKMLNQRSRNLSLITTITDIDELIGSETILETVIKDLIQYNRNPSSWWYRRRFMYVQHSGPFIAKALLQVRHPAYWLNQIKHLESFIKNQNVLETIDKLIINPPPHVNQREYEKLIDLVKTASNLRALSGIQMALHGIKDSDVLRFRAQQE
ncbi:MAG: hypothetical protein P1Q69_09210 [Candidatus Thorarchaeota archaeon]|nr:hypothetical protein [Candidatus Thorarchaeota archaeon]